MTKPPNILFLMSDEHRPDVTGYEGNEVIRTPTLDHLAETGVTFRNAYTPSPICVPGRQSMMSGQLPKTCGCEGWIDLEPGYLTFARYLSQHAYETVACGKLHHQGVDQMQGWTQRIGSDMKLSPKHIADLNKEKLGQYQRPFSAYKWDDTKEVKRAGIGRGPVVTRDEYTMHGALNFIENTFNSPFYDREQHNQPLLLKVSLLQPHYPYFTEANLFNYYLNRVEPFLDQPVFDHPFLSQRQVRPGVDASERELRRATTAYYGMVEKIDQHYQTILDALEHVGQNLDDWIIIYTSDHGEMLGEHGIWEKQKFFEASVRVPLLIRWPKGFEGGRIIQENVNLCDLFATLCDLTDLPIPSGLDSRSLKPFLNDESHDWSNESISQFGPTNVMIKQDQLKYQYYGEDQPEILFDLARNPAETEDYLNDADYAHQVAKFRARLAELGHGPNAYTNYTNAGY
ncbi:MAG: sulfatase-like hydrolase/transferase [Chloroflexota bacterium]